MDYGNTNFGISVKFWIFFSGVSVLTAFHNWGRNAPRIDQVFAFYNQFRDESVLDPNEDGLRGLSNIVEKFSNILYQYEDASGRIRTAGQEDNPELLRNPTTPTLIRGKQLSTITVDNVALYLADGPPKNTC